MQTFVKTPEDIALAIAYPGENSLAIAIRGGGLVIYLSRHLNTVEIDPENKLAYVGPIWEQLIKVVVFPLGQALFYLPEI